MTRREATLALLERFNVGARVVAYEYDPAGSDTSYVPEPRDVAVLEAFVGRSLEEKDFGFCVGAGHFPSRFYIGPALWEEIRAALSDNVTPEGEGRTKSL